jgi:catechol 2,3-dioxygenase-like lactoylglutathione lyase family enzyme
MFPRLAGGIRRRLVAVATGRKLAAAPLRRGCFNFRLADTSLLDASEPCESIRAPGDSQTSQTFADDRRASMTVKFGYTIAYVADVEATLSFYERAFELGRGFVAPDRSYGELATGTTTLAFAALHMPPIPVAPNVLSTEPAGIELAFVVEDVAGAYAHATSAGAVPVMEPADKPWGQTLAYVRDPNGILIELCTAVD